MERLVRISFLEEQPHPAQEGARDRLMITLGVAVHAPDALIVAADDVGKLLVDIDVGALQEQPGRGGKMGLVGPFLARQRTRKEAFADMLDLGVGVEKSRVIWVL